MIGLTDLEVCNSIFIKTEENNNFQLFTGSLYDELSYTRLKNRVAEVLGLSDISPEDLEDKMHGPHILLKFTEIYR